MNQPIDEKSLQAYLDRGSEYSARYREVEADDVPPELDRAVIAQATTAAKVTTLPLQKWRRYTVPMAMAATVVIAVTVVINVLQPPKFEPAVSAPVDVASVDVAPAEAAESVGLLALRLDTQPTSEPAAPPPADAFERAPARQETRQKLESEMNARREFEAYADRGASAPAAVAAPSALAKSQPAEAKQAVASTDQAAVTGDFIRAYPEDAATSVDVAARADLKLKAAERQSGPRNTVPTPGAVNRPAQTSLEEAVATESQVRARSAAGPRSNVQSTVPQGQSDRERDAEREADPRLWLDYIRELRNVGRSIDANREWDRFVKAYPNYAVAADDVARPKENPP